MLLRKKLVKVQKDNMKTTDFLTELSNTKLGKYKTAAGADATAADKSGNFKRGNKRMSGITNATKKEFANDAAKAAADAAAKAKKVDEGVNISPDQIQQMFQGAQNIGTAGGTNRSMIGKAKDMFSKPNPAAAPGLKQSTSVDPSVSAAQKPTTRVGKAAQSTRQQKQAQAAQAAQAGMTPAPAAPVATPAPVTPPAEPASYKDTFPKAAAAAERDKAAASIKPAVWKSNRKPYDPAKTSPTELSESQIYRLIGAIVNKHKKQVDEGVMDWAKTKGQNITNKITADKLLQAWNKAGKPTDSDQVAALMVKAGVPQETLNNLYTNFKLPAPQAVPAQPAQPKQGMLGRMAGGVGSAIGGIKGTIAGVKDAYGGNKMTGFDASRAKQGMQHVGHTGEVNPYTRATDPNNTAAAPVASNTTTNQGGPGTGNTIWHGPTTQTAATSVQAAAPTATNTTTSQPAAATSNAGAQATPKPGKVTVPIGKKAVDQAIATVKLVKPGNMPKVVNYGKTQFDKLVQTTAKQPATTTPDNTIAMPKQGEKIKWGGQEFRPGDPMYDQMKAASGTNESLGLNYPETYEQTNNKFKSKGQRRVAALTNEQNYDSGDYSNARMGREYGKRNYSVDSGASHFKKERVKNEPGGELGRPKSLAGASKSLPADPFNRTTGKIPKGKTGQVHKVDMDEGKQRIDTRTKNYIPIKESAILKGIKG